MRAKQFLFVFLIVSLALSLYIPDVKAQSTFGKTDKGGTEWQYSTTAGKCSFTLPVDGLVTHINIYVQSDSALEKPMDIGIYDGVTQKRHLNLNCPGSHYDGWVEADITDISLTAGIYDLAWKFKSTYLATFYDAGTTDQSQFDGDLLEADDLPDPFSEELLRDREYSIYANYTPSVEEEKSFSLTAITEPAASVYEFKEKLFYGTETFSFATALVLLQEIQFGISTTASITTIITETTFLKEMVFYYAEEIETVVTMFTTLEKAFVTFTFYEIMIVTAQAWMIKEIIAAPVEVTTFGTIAFVISIIALAIGVTALTAKKRL